MGWLRSVRFQKKRAFAQLDDGSGGVQLLLRPDTTAGFDGLRAQLSTGASVRRFQGRRSRNERLPAGAAM